MCRNKFMVGIAALLIGSVASAGTIGFQQAEYEFLVGAGNVAINIVASGGESIAGADVIVVIGDGGADLGGVDTAPPAPAMTNLHLAQGIFSGTDADNQSTLEIFSDGLVISRSITTAAGTRIQNGVLGQITLDLSNAAEGSYVIALDFPELGLGSGTVALGGVPVANQLSSARINIIPEPASALLLIGALPFLRRRTA